MALNRLKQEDHKSKASLGYIGLKEKSKKKRTGISKG